jgi:hypothetical protein
LISTVLETLSDSLLNDAALLTALTVHLPHSAGARRDGHVRAADRDGTRVYSLTKEVRRVAATQRSSSRWASLTARAEEGEDWVSVGSLLDAFAEASTLRRRLARTEQRGRIEAILARASAEIEGTLEEGENDG